MYIASPQCFLSNWTPFQENCREQIARVGIQITDHCPDSEARHHLYQFRKKASDSLVLNGKKFRRHVEQKDTIL